MAQLSLGWVAIGAAALAAFIFGAIWYGVLGKRWLRAARIDPAEAKMSPALFATSFVLLLVIAAAFAALFALTGVGDTLGGALWLAALAWLGFAFAPMAMNHRYQGFGWDLTLIDGLHWLGVFLIIAAVLRLLS